MRRAEFRRGLLAILPLLAGVFPFGMIYGVLAIAAGIPQLAAHAMSVIVFAGASQFVGAQMIGQAAPSPVVVLTIFVMNLRHSLYSASLAPWFEKLSAGWKALLAYLLVDEVYAIFISQPEKRLSEGLAHWFFVGAGLGLWTSWQTGTALGIFLGAQLPQSWNLDFTLPLTFIALLIPTVRNKPMMAAALAGGFSAVLLASLPFRIGFILAALIGILVGLVLESKWETSGRPS